MTTMLELAAKAIAVEWYCETGHNDGGAVAAAESQWKGFESLARAALQAIRDAGPAMIEAGTDGCGPVGCCNIEQDNVREVWTAMIDEALKGE